MAIINHWIGWYLHVIHSVLAKHGCFSENVGMNVTRSKKFQINIPGENVLRIDAVPLLKT